MGNKFTYITVLAGLALLPSASFGAHAATTTTETTATTVTTTTAKDAASAPGAVDAQGISDPLEKTNRKIFKFNNAVDHAVINPIIRGYRDVAPPPVRTGLRNFLRNLKSPTTFANKLLQGDFSGAGDVVIRALVNTTVGIGGLIDVAGHHGIKYEPEDFGQTMAVWGVPNGPYLVVPILGPSSLRDYAGYFVDAYADPLRIYLHNIHEDGWYYAKLGADYLDLRDSVMDVLADLEKSSIDYYAAVRSTYYQRRQAMIRNEAASASTTNFDMR